MIHIIGGDAVGMSTVQECIVANHMGIPVFAMSVITDLGLREIILRSHMKKYCILQKAAEPKLAAIFKELVGVL
jgi:purine-nucleoside phosphorylase